jgi:hypothetical protein
LEVEGEEEKAVVAAAVATARAAATANSKAVTEARAVATRSAVRVADTSSSAAGGGKSITPIHPSYDSFRNMIS